MFGGCGPAGPSVYERLQDEDPAVRADAVVQAGRTRNPQAVPYLVDRLTDSEADIRAISIISLEKITGRTMGYRHYAPAPQRLRAAERWREWLDSGRPAPAARTQPQQKDTQ